MEALGEAAAVRKAADDARARFRAKPRRRPLLRLVDPPDELEPEHAQYFRTFRRPPRDPASRRVSFWRKARHLAAT